MRVATALPQQYDGDAPPLVAPSSRKTKMDKNNTALGVRKKRRSHRVVHTRRSFHRAERRPVGESGKISMIVSVGRLLPRRRLINQSGECTLFSCLIGRINTQLRMRLRCCMVCDQRKCGLHSDRLSESEFVFRGGSRSSVLPRKRRKRMSSCGR